MKTTIAHLVTAHGVCLLLCLLALIGCESSQPAATDQSQVVDPVETTTTAESPESANSENTTESLVTTVVSTDSSEAFATDQRPEEEPAAWPPEDVEPRRLMLFGSRAPILADFYIAQSGRSIDDIAMEAAKETIQESDSDGDESTTWDELSAYAQQNGMGQSMARRNRRIVARGYDVNGDGKVQVDEYIAYYNRNEVSADWLAFKTMPSATGTDELPPLGMWLDSNDNGRLDPDEIQSAPARLLMRDGNDDGQLQGSEIRQPVSANFFNPGMQGRSIREEDVPAVVLDKNTDWEKLLYRLERRYTFSAPILPEDTESWPESFRELDDGDGTITADELALVADHDADLLIFFHLPGTQSYESSIRVEQRGNNSDLSEGNAVAIETGAGPFVMALPDNYLDQRVEEQFGFGFAQFDQDDDGVLTEEEFQLAQRLLNADFDEVDSDDDGEVTKDEMREALYPTRRDATVRLEMWLLNPQDPVAAALDQNHDSIISAEEIRVAGACLNEMDVDGDGTVHASETNVSMTIVCRAAGRGGPDLPPTPARLSQAEPNNSEIPKWFRAMDANRNGRIERREFIADFDTFEALDKNQDDALTVGEASE